MDTVGKSVHSQSSEVNLFSYLIFLCEFLNKWSFCSHPKAFQQEVAIAERGSHLLQAFHFVIGSHG